MMKQRFLPAHDNANAPLFAGDEPTPRAYLNIIKLDAGDTFRQRIEGFETVWVLMAGLCDLTVDGQAFKQVGGRSSVWDGPADSVYAGPGAEVVIEALQPSEIAVGGGRWDEPMPPFRISPSEVDMVDVGSNETKSRRRIFHILGGKAAGKVGHLLVSELYADEGCWSGYPSHKHGSQGEEETAHEEIYHWRFDPPTGFGAQLWYDEGAERTAYVTRDRDSFAFCDGYHPTVTSPGHRSYIFTILVGVQQRSLVQNFEVAHRHLMNQIPGIAAMREKFK
jgi:5-deoxy-glucuronate isomerase